VETLSTAVSKASSVISLVGPNSIFGLDPELFASFYKSLFPLMRRHNVRRIFAMGTISIPQPEDRFSVIGFLMVMLVFVVVNAAYRAIRRVEQVFEDEATGLDWTVYRIAGIPGGCDEDSWRKDRDDGETYEGWIGHQGWASSQRRGALARWLVDATEDGKAQWIQKMPAVSRLAGSKRKSV